MSQLSNERVVDSDSDLSDQDFSSFNPPRGFKKVKKIENIEKVSPKNLKNKEIWLIQVPSDFNIKKLKKLPVNLGVGRTTEFKVKDTEYALNEDLAAAEHNVLKKRYKIMSAQNEKSLQPVSKLEISRFYSVSEKVRIPEIDHGKVVTQRRDVEQHADLRMRHFPTGYGKDNYEEAKREDKPVATPHKRKSEDFSKKEKKHKKDKKKKDAED
ncbi:hypothetical protein OGATHE_002693 [Ogataea polymorpha]|uniref:DNA-directed RNA polymerase I subunit RPA34 n=1 Tax=Ogataea polymorpha TaxID=460523 RepID=A0A9P8PDM3_9ASCO|nr:hypothetical protein KL927_000847 [Ogataea polymorpha]KAH3669881.1 hypothetical protein OGATHE_002693 [Ogataea polymorpha]